MGDLNSIICMNEDLEILILQEPLPSAMHLIIERVSPPSCMDYDGPAAYTWSNK